MGLPLSLLPYYFGIVCDLRNSSLYLKRDFTGVLGGGRFFLVTTRTTTVLAHLCFDVMLLHIPGLL